MSNDLLKCGNTNCTNTSSLFWKLKLSSGHNYIVGRCDKHPIPEEDLKKWKAVPINEDGFMILAMIESMIINKCCTEGHIYWKRLVRNDKYCDYMIRCEECNSYTNLSDSDIIHMGYTKVNKKTFEEDYSIYNIMES